ncbi:MAG: GTP binding protein [Monoraphidium minutum]|nr:MAG: GTP binding protein [Monoraphidium minutum]
MAAALARLAAAAEDAGAELTVLRERPLPPEALAAAGGGGGGAPAASGAAAAPAGPEGGTGYVTADVLVRQRAKTRPALEVRVAVVGNVDSGKSTLVGVLTRGTLDDGRGLARSKVFKHHHEEATGRTSSIGQHNLCLDARGAILNDALFRNSSCSDYVSRSAKVVTLVDLAGHEKYFRTTAFGLTGHLPDYACMMLGANMGVVGMAKEHLGVALALKVPVFFVVTKTDICPEHVLRATVASLASILRKPGVRRRPFLVRSPDDALLAARSMGSEALAPIFLTSAVTGAGLDLVRLFYGLLPQRQRWSEVRCEPPQFIIDEVFGVPGVGTVVAGTVKRGVLTPGSALVIGPDIADGSFKPVAIKSIHYKRLGVAQVVAGQTAALALKKVKRSQVRKGMVLLASSTGGAGGPRASFEFDADIAILTHSTTIAPRYQAVIHCEIIRQAARVVAMDREHLRSGDRARIRWRFIQHPEWLTPGTRFVFREGRTKGIGVVVAVQGDAPDTWDAGLAAAPQPAAGAHPAAAANGGAGGGAAEQCAPAPAAGAGAAPAPAGCGAAVAAAGAGPAAAAQAGRRVGVP